MRRFKRDAFTVTELLMATLIVSLMAALTFVLLGSVTQIQDKRSHRYEALDYAAQTIDTLKDYVTLNVTDLPTYELAGDAANCGGPGPLYALEVSIGQGWDHCHPLPAGDFVTQLGATRTYTVEDVDLDPLFDSDGNGTFDDDQDLQRVVVTVTYNDQE